MPEQLRQVNARTPRLTGVPVIGLTGGIGSGKSAAADAFAALGAAIVDTDAIAHALTAPGGLAIAAIGASFGPAFIDATGALNRAVMRQHVFDDPAARQRLEGLLHPLIRAESDRLVTLATADPATPYVMLVVPLLVESGTYAERVDRVCVVDCPESTQVERVMQRSALAAEQVRHIMAAQASRAERLAAADDVIANHTDLAALHAQVARLDSAYRSIRGQNAPDGRK